MFDLLRTRLLPNFEFAWRVRLSPDFEYEVRKQNYDDRIEYFDAFYAHVGNFKSAEERARIWWSCWNHICKKFNTLGMLQIEKLKLGSICSESI